MTRVDPKLMKKMNKQLMRRLFHSKLELTAAQLVKETGISTVTVNALIKEMLEDKEIFKRDLIPSKGGRPSRIYRLNEMQQAAAIIYGVQKNNQDYITCLVTNLLGEVISREEKVLECIVETSFEPFLDALIQSYPMIQAICFGLPGAEEQGSIKLCDYPMLIGKTFMKHYEQRYQMPVLFVNDINAAVNGYYYDVLHGESLETVIGVFFPRRYLPGAGILIKGEIYKGCANFAGELGALPLGIDWLTLDYDNHQMVSQAIATLLATMSCMVAPKYMVLYGDFLTADHAALIKQETEKILKNQFSVQVMVSNDLNKHYELGLIKFALEQLNISVQTCDE